MRNPTATRASETVIDRRDNGNRDEQSECDGQYDLLAPLFLGARTRPHPPLQELRIVFHEVHCDRERGGGKYRQENPPLPIVDGPGGEEQ
jgi:hypothetical protein